MGYPILSSFWISLHQYNLKRPNIFLFVGFNNYITILKSSEFWQASRITLIFSSISVVLIISFGLLIALLKNEPFPGRSLARLLL